MDDPVEVRPLSTLADVRAASALLDRIWQERRVMGAPLLRAMAAHGGQVLGAFDGGELIGALVGLVGLTEEARPVLHSHITGVAPETQHRGVGFELKRAQRDWCLARGIDVVTWTMDPMVARNARFNLHKLGAEGVKFHRDYYLTGAKEAVGVGGRASVHEAPRLVIRVPDAYHALREADPGAAAAWRDGVADGFEAAFDRGYRAIGFVRSVGYVLERG
jgi:predicted GNAT superfamily acetyltransferase